MYAVSIKDRLWTTDCGLGIKYRLGIKRWTGKYELGIKHGLGIKHSRLRTGYKIRTTDYFGKNGANWF